MADPRAVICGCCHALFSTSENPPYVGYDHMLEAHFDLLVEGHAGDVVLRDVTAAAKALIDAVTAEVEEAAA